MLWEGFFTGKYFFLGYIITFFKHLPSALPEFKTANISWATSKISQFHTFLLYSLKKFMLKGAL